MGLFGGNKPIWMSAGLSSVKALRYVKACEDQEELVQIVLNGKLDNYKEAALLNIKDKNVLKDLAKKLDTNLAIKALLQAEDEEGLKSIIDNTDKEDLYSVSFAIRGINDEDYLYNLAKENLAEPDLLTECAKKINNQSYLSELGKKWNPFAAKYIAEKTNDVELLRDMVKSYSSEPPHPGQLYAFVEAENEVHRIAEDRLRKLKQQ